MLKNGKSQNDLGQKKQYKEGSRDLKVHCKEWSCVARVRNVRKGCAGIEAGRVGASTGTVQRVKEKCAHLGAKE